MEASSTIFSSLEAMMQVDIDFETEPIGTGKDGKNIFFRDIWPSSEEVANVSCPTCFTLTPRLKLLGTNIVFHYCTVFRLYNQVCFLICLKLHMKQSPKEIPRGINYLYLQVPFMPGIQHQLTSMSHRTLKT